MKILKYVLKLFLLFLLLIQSGVSIATESNYAPQDAKREIFWQESQNLQTALSGCELKNSFPEKQWWLLFNDPLLNNYIERALSQNQDIKIAFERINEANALARYYLGQEFPQITLNDVFFRVDSSSTFPVPNAGGIPGSNSSILTGGTSNVYILPLITQYELDLFRRKRYQTKSAEKTALATKYDYQTILINLTANIASSYFNLLETDKLLKLQTELLQILRKTLELRVSLYTQGLISYDDILINEQSIAEAESNIASIQKLQGLLVHQICILTGVPPISQTTFARSDFDSITLNKEIQVGIPSELIARRPDILSSEAQLQKSGIDVSVARRAFFPTIDILGTFGYASTDLKQFFDWDSNTAAIGSIVRQTLFTGGSKTANLNANKARYRGAVQNYQKTILAAFQEVEDSLSKLNSDFNQFKQSENEIKMSQQLLSLTNTRYEEGVNSILDVLSAQQQLISFEQNKTQSKANILIDNISLYKALGGGF